MKIEKINIIFLSAVIALTLSGCDSSSQENPIAQTSTVKKGDAGSILAIKVTDKGKILASVPINDTKITKKSIVQKAASLFGKNTIVEADSEAASTTPSYVAKLPSGAKNISYLSSTKLIYLVSGDGDGADHAKQLVLYSLDTDQTKVIYTAQDGFVIDELQLSPDKKLAALWEVKLNSKTKQILGGESKITQISLENFSAKTIVGPQKTEEFDNGNELLDKQFDLNQDVTVSYPLFYDSQNRLWLDSWLPNSSGTWGAGVKRVDQNGTVANVAGLEAGSYSADPVSSKNGRYIALVRPDAAQEQNQLGISFAQEKPRKISIIDCETGTEKEIALPDNTYLLKQTAVSNDGKLVAFTGYDNSKNSNMLYLHNVETGTTQSVATDSATYLVGFSGDQKNIVTGIKASDTGVANSAGHYLPAFSSYTLYSVSDLSSKNVASSDFAEIVDTLDKDTELSESSLLANEIKSDPNAIVVSAVNLPDEELVEARTTQQNTLPESVNVSVAEPEAQTSSSTPTETKPSSGRDQFTKDCEELIPGYSNAKSPSEVSDLFEESSLYTGLASQCKTTWEYFRDVDAGEIYKPQNQSAELTRYWHWFYWCFWDESMKDYGYLQLRGVKYNPNSLYTQHPLLRKCLNMGRGNCEDKFLLNVASVTLNGSALDHMKCYDSPLYLYPQEKTQVQVKAKNLLYNTAPDYLNPIGWLVTAEPSGKLTSTNGQVFDKISYDYTQSARALKTGYVVSQVNLKPTLEKYAQKLGFNQKESADFVSFWVSKLSGTAPYIQISHYGAEESQQINPLEISPKPDTYIPVVMYFKKLQMPIVTAPPIFESIKDRQGFTAVEWSGIIQ